MEEIESLRDHPEFKLFLATFIHKRKNRDSIHESNEESASQNKQAKAETECMPVLPLNEENFDVSSNPSRKSGTSALFEKIETGSNSVFSDAKTKEKPSTAWAPSLAPPMEAIKRESASSP